jgi:hypothetical protein
MTTGALLYYGGLALWSAFFAYMLLFVALKRKSSSNPKEAPAAPSLASRPSTEYARMSAPSAPAPTSATKAPSDLPPFAKLLSEEGFKAFQRGPELTVDDIVKGLSRTGDRV